MKQFAIALDQALNTCVYIEGDGWGMADETLSARAWRCYLQGLISARAYLAIDAMFWWQPNHCYLSWRAEWERLQFPHHYQIGAAQ